MSAHVVVSSREDKMAGNYAVTAGYIYIIMPAL